MPDKIKRLTSKNRMSKLSRQENQTPALRRPTAFLTDGKTVFFLPDRQNSEQPSQLTAKRIYSNSKAFHGRHDGVAVFGCPASADCAPALSLVAFSETVALRARDLRTRIQSSKPVRTKAQTLREIAKTSESQTRGSCFSSVTT